MSNKNSAFSLVELSIVILVIGILVAAVAKGSSLYQDIKLTGAKSVTKSSVLNSMKDLVLWLEATDASTIESEQNGLNIEYGDNVSAWHDIRIVSNFDKITLAQDAASNDQPRYDKNGINGLPSIYFDGINDRLFTSNTPLKAGDDEYTMIAVWQAHNNLSGRMIMAQNTGAVYSMAGMFIPTTTTVAFAGDHCDFSTTIKSHKNKNITAIVVNNNNLTENINIYTNSNTPVSGKSIVGTCAGPQSLNLSDDRFNVGSQSNLGQYFYGHISEVIIFDRNLSQQEISSINSYLSQKYGIKIGS